MKLKRTMCLLTAVMLLLMLAGCGSDEAAVYVQSVAELSGMGGIAPGDRFAGIVVSENVAEIQKDGEKTIAELLVREGDDVKEGDALFSYDMEELQLTLDKQKLELEQLKASIENYESQIKELEKDRSKVSGSDKLHSDPVHSGGSERGRTEPEIQGGGGCQIRRHSGQCHCGFSGYRPCSGSQ